jgi:hypothetical protein
MTTSNTDVLLGTVIGQLEGIEKRLDRQDASRGVLHDKVNGMVMRLTHMESDVFSLKDKVEGIEKVTGAAKELSLKAQGAGWLGSKLLGLGGWVLGAAVALYQFWGWLKAWFITPG